MLLLHASMFQATASRSAGILYEVWHCNAATAMAQVKAKGYQLLTTERVIQSNGQHTLDDVFPAPGRPYASADVYNVEPSSGFYCLCSKRTANDTLPDCPMASLVARKHAAMLSSAGFDYIAVDVTNWPQVNSKTDVAVLRPLENLFDEWIALRRQGLTTPAIAVWVDSPVASYTGSQTTWQWMLDHIYNNATRAPLIWRMPSAQRSQKTFFLPDNGSYNASVQALIESNGGRGDIHTVKMWALFGKSSYARGSWGFFSPCTSPSAPHGGYTTSMVGTGGPCNQYESLRSSAGGAIEEVTASGGYMLSQCALPFAAPGHMRGLTLQRTFERVLEVGAPNLFMSSFNEHIGGRQKAAYHSNVAINMGLPNDPQRESVWVDTYAAEFSRDIEPTVEGGSRVWEVASSCVQLYKAGLTCTAASAAASACCTTADKHVYANAWSLVDSTSGDAIVTSSAEEMKQLLTKPGWSQRCHSITGPSVFCVNTTIRDGRDGPFMLFNDSTAITNPRPLNRCVTGGGAPAHFLSADTRCEGLGTIDRLIGHMASTPGGDTLRALRRCDGASPGTYTHALDLDCDVTQPVLGYVR